MPHEVGYLAVWAKNGNISLGARRGKEYSVDYAGLARAALHTTIPGTVRRLEFNHVHPILDLLAIAGESRAVLFANLSNKDINMWKTLSTEYPDAETIVRATTAAGLTYEVRMINGRILPMGHWSDYRTGRNKD